MIIRTLRSMTPCVEDVENGLAIYKTKLAPTMRILKEAVLKRSYEEKVENNILLIKVKEEIVDYLDKDSSEVENYYLSILESTFNELLEYCPNCDIELKVK